MKCTKGDKLAPVDLIVFKSRERKTSQIVNAVAAFNNLNKNGPLP